MSPGRFGDLAQSVAQPEPNEPASQREAEQCKEHRDGEQQQREPPCSHDLRRDQHKDQTGADSDHDRLQGGERTVETCNHAAKHHPGPDRCKYDSANREIRVPHAANLALAWGQCS